MLIVILSERVVLFVTQTDTLMVSTIDHLRTSRRLIRRLEVAAIPI
jgi:hypothetical protein